MRFGPLQKIYFQAEEGAFSVVTPGERSDGQITVTIADGEASVVETALGAANIPRSAAGGKRQQVTVIRRDESEQAASLTINYPKPSGQELRIYRSVSDGFDFEAGDIWYVFSRRGRQSLYVGCMTESKWRSIGTTDDNDQAFQDLVDSPTIPAQAAYVEFAGQRIARDPGVARAAVEKACYQCEYSGQPSPFLSKRTGKPYIEAHHLIPLGLQPRFAFNLDIEPNITALNPLWHRAIHSAEPRTVRSILKVLASKRASFLDTHRVTQDMLMSLYGCEKIR